VSLLGEEAPGEDGTSVAERGGTRPGETNVATRDDEEQRERYRELLEEYRTILPGVQVLLAFLLTVPFSQRFEQLDDLGRDLFMLAIVTTAVAMLLFLTPTAFHRLAPQAGREERLRIAIRTAVPGMLAVAVSVVTAVFVVTRFVYDDDIAALVAGMIAALAVALWLVVPLVRRLRTDAR
jgi:uncharacterized membrane protein